MKEEHDINLVTVFTSHKDALIGVAKSLLDDAGIEYEATNPYGSGATRIVVRSEDAEEAKSLIEGIGVGSEETEETDSSYTDEPSFSIPDRQNIVSESTRYSNLGILVLVIIVILLAFYFVRC